MSLKIAIIGGGGFRTPLVYQALLDRRDTLSLGEIVLHDTDERRLSLMAAVVTALAAEHGTASHVRTTTDLVDAVSDADFVMCAIRVGGLEGRIVDEVVPLAEHIVGQETTGPGGVCFALRTLPVITSIAEVVAKHAPRAWFLNFTNPAGLITEALRDVLGDRVVGICDSPSALCRRVAAAFGRNEEELRFDYAGLNHLGWLLGAHDEDGDDLLRRLLADTDTLSRIREVELFGVDWLQSLGVLPNEYLAYYYYATNVVETLASRSATRGQYLLDQQAHFYSSASLDPAFALRSWRAARVERSSTYLAEAGRQVSEVPAGELDIATATHLGGYGGLAVSFMTAVATDSRATLILNVANRRALPFCDDDAVVEVPCVVSRTGPVPLTVGRLPDHAVGLVVTIKEVERLTIRAARERSTTLAVKALALHPLVQSVDTARKIFAEYVERQPTLREPFAQ